MEERERIQISVEAYKELNDGIELILRAYKVCFDKELINRLREKIEIFEDKTTIYEKCNWCPNILKKYDQEICRKCRS